jgi:ABC-type nitrate/sulfonate/bicarbonate transport system substrate-binding protein
MSVKIQVVLLTLIFNVYLASAASAQLTKLNAAYSAESSWSHATWVAYDGGFFKKYGLDVDLVLIRSAAIITAALLAGEAPMIQLKLSRHWKKPEQCWKN